MGGPLFRRGHPRERWRRRRFSQECASGRKVRQHFFTWRSRHCSPAIGCGLSESGIQTRQTRPWSAFGVATLKNHQTAW